MASSVIKRHQGSSSGISSAPACFSSLIYNSCCSTLLFTASVHMLPSKLIFPTFLNLSHLKTLVSLCVKTPPPSKANRVSIFLAIMTAEILKSWQLKDNPGSWCFIRFLSLFHISPQISHRYQPCFCHTQFMWTLFLNQVTCKRGGVTKKNPNLACPSHPPRTILNFWISGILE